MHKTAVRIATAAIAATGLLGAGAVAAAAVTSTSIPSSDGTITGCYSTATTSLRAFFLIDRQSGATCPRGFTQIAFSQRGPAGATGAVGPKGDAGASGATGPAGAPGTDGPQGPAGPGGVPGATGVAGPEGPAGPIGAQGVPGETGPAGPTGPAGAEGPAGPAGNADTVITTTTDYTIPAGVHLIRIQAWGGGGSGGIGEFSYGGGQGGFVTSTWLVNPGDVLAITIGAGGNPSTHGDGGATTATEPSINAALTAPGGHAPSQLRLNGGAAGTVTSAAAGVETNTEGQNGAPGLAAPLRAGGGVGLPGAGGLLDASGRNTAGDNGEVVITTL